MANVKEFKMGYEQLKEYIYMPLIKFFASILLGLIAAFLFLQLTIDKDFLLVTLTLALVFLKRLLPLLIIAIQHKRISSGVSFSVNKDLGTFQYSREAERLWFDVDQIKKVIKVVSPSKYDKRIDLLGFGHFFYWKIILKDDKTINISCLVLDIENFFGMYLEQEKKFFVFPTNQSQASRL